MGKDGPSRGMKVSVAAFGKHPGWDDHIEEIGLDNDTLIRSKRVLYTECIAGNIDSGAWDRLDDAKRLAGFKHQFYWRTSGGLIVGRMWASRDGKGRTKYPMVVCGMVSGVPEWWAIERIAPRLAAIEEKCGQTQSAELVRLAIGEARRGLEEEVALIAVGGLTAINNEASLVRKLVTHPELNEGGTPVGLHRVMYEIEREMAIFRPETSSARAASRLIESAAQHIRVPSCLTAPGEAARAWLNVLSSEVGPSTPLLLVEPADEGFIDIIAGDPRPSHLFCVRASRKGLALTTEVPYTLDEAFVTKAGAKISAWSSGQSSSASRAAAVSPEADDGKKRITPLMMAITGGVLVLALIGIILLLRGGGEKPEQAPVPDPKARDTGVAPTSNDAAPVTNGAKGSTNTATSNGTTVPVTPPPTPPKQYGSDDPRAGWSFDVSFADAKARAARLASELEAEGKTIDPTLQQKLDRAAKRADIAKGMAAPSTAVAKESLLREMQQAEAQAGDASREIDAQLGESAGRVSAWLADQSAKPPVRNEAMKRSWQAAIKNIPAREGWSAARAKVSTLEGALKSAERAFESLPAVNVPAELASTSGAVQLLLQTRSDEAATAAADAAASGDGPRALKAAQDLSQWRTSAAEVLAGVAALERSMNAGSLDAQAGESLDRLRQAPAFQSLASSVGPVLQRAQAVRTIADSRDVGTLVSAIADAKRDTSRARAAEVSAALEGLSAAPWSGSADDAAKVVAAVRTDAPEVIAKIAPGAGQDRLKAQLGTTAASVWKRAASSLAASADGRALITKMATDLSVPASERANLAPWVRFNLARAELEAAAASAQGKPASESAGTLRNAAKSFVAEAASLGTVAAAAPMAEVLKPLAEKGGDVDFSTLGPGAAGWRLEAADPDRPVFVKDGPGGQRRIPFVKTEGAGEMAGFVSATEVSVGLFISTINDAAKWDVARSILAQYDPTVGDRRQGPRVWEWGDRATPPMAIASEGAEGNMSKGWLRSRPGMSGKGYYPPGMSIETPSAESPMQYVSPRAAILTARLLGCRLPTAGEWAEAVKLSDGAGANRRDATWKRVYDHLKPMEGSDPEWPAGGAFLPAGSKLVKPADDGAAATAQVDGIVWFAPVSRELSGGNPPFKHLVGNVAEFVFNSPEALDGLTDLSAAGLKAAIGKGDSLKVIGGSALSGPTIDPAEPQPVRLSLAEDGFSDVGFRLAFSAAKGAGAGDAAKRVNDALAAGGYLSAP